MVDVYTMAENLGSYSGFLVLMWEYNVGLAILAAGSPLAPYVPLSEVIVKQLMPLLESATKREADVKLDGNYTTKDNANSSISLSTDSDLSGLQADSLIYNGSDITGTGVGGVTAEVALILQPTGLTTKRDDGTTEASHRVISQIAGNQKPVGLFASCSVWQAVDSQNYGTRAVDRLVFRLDKQGCAIGIKSDVFKIELLREDDEGTLDTNGHGKTIYSYFVNVSTTCIHMVRTWS